MNAVAGLQGQSRRAASPYARRLARERELDLATVIGSGPHGRIVAADILSWQPKPADRPAEPLAPPPLASPPVVSFSASVNLAALGRLAADAARVGLDITIEDAAARAAQAALGTDAAGGLAIEAEGRQIRIATATGLSIGAERQLRLTALASGADLSGQPAQASLLVLHAARVTPAALPLLPSRMLRFVLVIDRDREQGHALLCANAQGMTEHRAAAVLEAFISALEQPLALLA